MSLKKKHAYGYERPTLHRPSWKRFVLRIIALGLALVAIGLAIAIFWPDVAAQNIDRLRDIIGDTRVAQLEEMVLSIKDRTQQLEYSVGLVKPAAPWVDSPTEAVAIQPTPSLYNMVTHIPTDQATLTNTPASTVTSLPTFTPLPPGVVTATTAPYTPVPTATDAPISGGVVAWQLSSLVPLGNLAGEGQWSPYLFTADGKITVAYRTFLQPDPQRPYSVTAIVAFNLQATRLHFVLGTVEPIPQSPQPSRTGTIPSADLQPGVLLATFNGGFKARHGQYGAMADGLIALPPITGLATVAMYADGRVQIGEWGTAIQDVPDLVAWRQNGEMLIQNSQINPATAETYVSWGRTIAGSTITWRSALGLSADRQTLYYGVGLQLDAPTLAKAMARAGASEALELDVNNYWVHFAAIRRNGPSFMAEPLLSAMNLQADRYLKGWSRDFFYITTVTKR
jgi:Phosphodiester glycosidase